MIITIREISEEFKENGEPKYIEWDAVGADGKEIKPKIYPAIQVNEQWIHFKDRWDEFKNAKNKTYDIERASVKVEQGTWMPVIKATEVKDVLAKEAIAKVTGNNDIIKNKSVALSYAKDLVTAGKIDTTEIVDYAEAFYRYMIGGLKIEDTNILNKIGGNYETTEVVKDSEDTTEPPTGEVSGHSGGEEPEPTTKAERIERCRELATQANRGSNYLKAKYKTTDINRLTIAQLTELEQDLQGQIEASEFF